MSNMTIFKQPGAIATQRKGELSELAKTLASANITRRIQTNTNGTFKRLVNGEQIGNAIRGEINVIIVAALPKVSRIFYEKDYDPNAEPTIPDCWSNLGDKPEENAPYKQHANCAECPKNIKGSGKNNTRACRFQRRIAVLVEGDDSGDVYQFNIPSKSLFGKGEGNVHPFESYIKFLIANGESPDNVVTNVSYDINAEQMELLFTPIRHINDDEYELVKAAQSNPSTKMLTTITVAAADKVTKKPEKEKPAEKPASKPKVTRSEDPDDEADTPPPQKRGGRKPAVEAAPPEDKDAKLATIIDDWINED